MASFFDKLKKGMGIENLSEEKPAKEKIPKETEVEDKLEIEPTETEIIEEKTKKRKSKKIKEEIKNNIEIKELEKEEPIEEIPQKESKTKKIKIEKEKSKTEEKNEIEKSKAWFEPEGQLAVDVFQTDGEIIIQSAVAGIKPEELDISIENDVVTIRGSRGKTFEEEGTNYFYQECYWGRFSREIILPAEVDPSRAEAAMKNGILTIRIPKIEKEKKRKIDIK